MHDCLVIPDLVLRGSKFVVNWRFFVAGIGESDVFLQLVKMEAGSDCEWISAF